MLFSVIIPTYNRAHLIESTVLSILAQTYHNFELIIIDDGSTDNTTAVIEKIKDNRLSYYKKEKAGVSSARNYGLELSKGDYINFFDSDDIAYSNHLMEAHKYFTENINSDILMFDYEWGDSNKKNIKEVLMRYENPNQAILSVNFPQVNSVFLKRHVFDSVKFNESLSISEDWDLWLRLSVRYTFDLGKIKTSYLIDHSGRTVRAFNAAHFLKQKDNLILSLKNDYFFYNRCKKSLKKIDSHMSSYIALHSAMNGLKILPIKLFFKSILLSPISLFSRRTLGIIKQLTLIWAN